MGKLFQRKDGTFYVYLKKKIVDSFGWKHGDQLEHSVKNNKYELKKGEE